MTKKQIAAVIDELYRKHGHCVQVDVMDLSKILGPVEAMLKNGGSIDHADAMMQNKISQYRKN